MTMTPLQKSWTANELEADLKALFIALYTEALGDKSDEINVYGAPHIGPFSLVEREVAKDGLAVLRTTQEDAIRHLFKSFRFRNPRRGTHFLKTYLQVLFGSSHEISQLWQRKSSVYPLSLLTDSEVKNGGLENDYYLTSRLRVDIDTEYLTSLLKQVLRTTVAARFVMDVRTAKYGLTQLGIAGVGEASAILNATNVTELPGGIPPPYTPAPDDFGTVKRMLSDLWAYIRRATGVAAHDAKMPALVTTEGLVKRSQASEKAFNGFTAADVSSSEAVSLLMRGVAHAYFADKDPTKLVYLKFLMDAVCKYHFFNARPSANGEAWHHTALVNAGTAFHVRGPLAANGQLDQGGYIGRQVTFSGGVAYLDPPPDIVYQVVTDGTTFEWSNVLAPIKNTSGTPVEVDYYIDADGNKIRGAQRNNEFGQPIEPGSTETPGMVVLKEALSGVYQVNYCATVDAVSIAYGEPYEAWPMWRKLASGERVMAADALHWFVDAFRHLRDAEPGNPEWALAHSRMLDVWQSCCTQESAIPNVFLAGSEGPYNNFPRTASYAYGRNNVDDASTAWTQPPGAHYTADRSVDGFVSFTLPSANALPGSGGAVRNGVVFENTALYLSYNEDSLFSVDTQATEDVVLTLTITSKAGEHFQTPIQASDKTTVVLVGMNQFMRFGLPGAEAAHWLPGAKTYNVGSGTTHVIETLGTVSGRNLLADTYTLPNVFSGVGIAFGAVPLSMVISAPPKICYQATSDFLLTIRDNAGWLWVAPCPAQDALSERSWDWSMFVLATTQDPAKDGVTAPGSPTGPLKSCQFTGAAGSHGDSGTTPQSISLAYLSGVSPTLATSGDIHSARLENKSPDAHTWKVGNVALVNGERDIAYYGALPYTLTLGGPDRAHLAEVPFRGPYVAGSQSGTPWIELDNETKLGNMLDFMLQSQLEFQARNPASLLGPFMHSYLPATWDSAIYGEVDTWVWDAPDGNPTWSGWQYRAFDAMAHTWKLAVERSFNSTVVIKAATVSTRFMTWMFDWLTANPEVHYVPSSWGPQGWSEGDALSPESYLSPQGVAVDAHALALVLKGAIYSANAGADATKCKYIIARCIHALLLVQVHSVIDPMRGCFTLNPADFESYSFQQGEIMDALALAMINQDLLPDDAKTVDLGGAWPAGTRVTADGEARITQALQYRVIQS